MIRPGVRLGVDVGQARVGLAACDPQALIATPVQTLTRDHDGLADIEAIVAQAHERAAVEVIVGLPRSLSGAEGAAAGHARTYAGALHTALAGIPVRLWDERLTTVDAHRGLRASGVPGRKHRESVDQVAAVLILQGALDAERTSGNPAGEVVGQRKARHSRTTQHTKGRQS